MIILKSSIQNNKMYWNQPTVSKPFYLNDDSELEEQPIGISLKLKQHQLAVLDRMYRQDVHKRIDLVCERDGEISIETNFGILGDKPASGKTIEILALMVLSKERDECRVITDGIYYSHSYQFYFKKEYKIKEKPHIKTNLIVVPHSLLGQWIKHLDMTSLEYEVVDKKNFTKILVDTLDAVLCSDKLYNLFMECNTGVVWNRVVIDEADSIKIPNMHTPEARFIWFITATFESIPFSKTTRHFIKFMHYTLHKHYKYICVKCNDEFIDKSLKLMSYLTKYIFCELPDYLQNTSIFDAKTIEFINTGNIAGAIEGLGGNVDTDKNIMTLIVKKVKNKLIELESAKKTTMGLDIPTTEKEEKVKKMTREIETLEADKNRIVSEIEKVSENTCAICTGAYEGPVITNCHHMFCGICIMEWLKQSNKCPICRETVILNKLIAISDKKGKKSKQEIRDKYDECVKLILDEPTEKWLVFSHDQYVFRKLAEMFNKENIKWNKLTPCRIENSLKEFQSGKAPVILLNSVNFGAGLEIPWATRVIIFNKLTPDVENQCIGRAQRPSRTSQLTVYKLGYEHEYTNVQWENKV